MNTALCNCIDALRDFAVELERTLTGIPAVSPDSGGEGELRKCEALEKILRAEGITQLERVDIPDPRAAGGVRPNLIATIAGDGATRLWLISHLDVVPPGEAKLWSGDPWVMREADGKIYGRGVEDNQQGLVSSVLAALALRRCGILPARTLKLLFAADEECGSHYGVIALLKRNGEIAARRGEPLFRDGDAALIPDGGDSAGETIEIAEKASLWLKLTTLGKQTHGSRPDTGKNAFLAGSALALRLHERLHTRFNEHDSIFEPDYSTFEPTKKEANVPNINTIPGEDVFYMDMRILPRYAVDDVIAEINNVMRGIEEEYGVSVSLEVLQRAESPPTPDNAPVVRALGGVLREALGVTPRPVGIGGGTVAACLRNRGIDAAVWSKLDDTAHNPNEYAIISNILDEAKVMAHLALQAF